MKVSTILFESSEVRHEKTLEVEKENITTLKQTQDEIRALLEALIPKEEVLPFNKEVVNPYINNFPVDHRIVK